MEAPASNNLALPLIYFNFLPRNLSKFSQFEKFFPADHLKAEKIGGYESSFLAICNFEFFFLYLKFGPMNFSYQQALGRAKICLTVQQILGN